MNIFSSLVVALLFTVTFLDVALAEGGDDMTPIDSAVDQDITGISIGLSCNGVTKLPNTMFTVVTSDEGVTVETTPANLVTVKSSGGTLSFEWNEDVASTADGAGVRIAVPTSQLLSVSVSGGLQAQVLDGFTSITKLQSSGAAILHASMTSSVSNELELSNSGDGEMYVATNVPVTGGSVSGASQSWVETPSYNSISVSGASKLNVKGDVDVGSDSGSVSGASRLVVTGTITGSIGNSGASAVDAQSCDTVSDSGASECNVGSQTVDVDVGEKSQTLSGTYRCLSIFGSSSSPSFGTGYSVAISIAAASAAVTAMLI